MRNKVSSCSFSTRPPVVQPKMLPHIGSKTHRSIRNSPNFVSRFFFTSWGLRHFLKRSTKGVGTHRLMVAVVATSLHSASLQKPTLFAQKADCRKTFFLPTATSRHFSHRDLAKLTIRYFPTIFYYSSCRPSLRPLLFSEFGLERKLTFWSSTAAARC